MNETGAQPGEVDYEQAKAEILAIVAQLESGTLTLAESLTAWERAEALARRCQTLLDGAQARLAGAADEPS